MILVVGGVGSGRRTYARTLMAGAPGATREVDCAALDGADLSAVEAACAPGTLLVDAQVLAASLLAGDARAQDVAAAEGATSAAPSSETAPDASAEAPLDELAARIARCAVVTYAEQGCGVVPLDPTERALREAAGRLGCELARRATAVIRMTCGIPQPLKGVGVPDAASILGAQPADTRAASILGAQPADTGAASSSAVPTPAPADGASSPAASPCHAAQGGAPAR